MMLDPLDYGEGGLDGELGLTLVTASFALVQDRNTFHYFPRYGLSIVRFNKHPRNQDFEMVLELNCAIDLARQLTVQPAIQYILDPVGRDEVSDAFVLGAKWFLIYNSLLSFSLSTSTFSASCRNAMASVL